MRRNILNKRKKDRPKDSNNYALRDNKVELNCLISIIEYIMRIRNKKNI